MTFRSACIPFENRPKHSPVWVLLPLFLFTSVVFFALILPRTSNAQSPNQLDRLIFVPSLIDQAETEPSGTNLISLSPPLNDTAYPVDTETTNTTQTRDEITKNISAYRSQIQRIETQNGPFSQELYEILLDLGTQLQHLEEHESAIEVFERAEHISRINNGLFHPDQFTSIEKLIVSYLAIGDDISANQKQRYLVYLNEEYFGARNINTLPSLVEFADRNMLNFSTTMGMASVPSFSFTSGNNSTGMFGGSSSQTPREMAFGNLFQAQLNYFRAISTMIDNKQYFDPLLLELEYRYLETLFLQSYRTAILREPDYYLSEKSYSTGSLIKHDYNRRYSNGYIQGKSAFERILIYISNNPEAKLYQLVLALMEFGDWNLLYGKGSTAQRKYLDAYNLVLEMNVKRDDIDQIFRPKMPVHLPLFTAKPNSREKFGIPRDQELDYTGYIDIAFTISRYGSAKNMDILAASESSTGSIERRLRRYLRNSPFRPTIGENGEFIDNRVTLRYFFIYNDELSDEFIFETSDGSSEEIL